MENNNTLNDNNIDSQKIPLAQKVILAVILLGYPLFSTLMYYINPPSERLIESRIIQVYVPALFFQMMIIFGIVFTILKTPVAANADRWGLSKSLTSLGIKKSDFSIINLAAGIVFLFAAVIVLNIISNIINYYNIFQAEDIAYLLPRTSGEKVFWIIISIAAGIAEEICFRGYVISRMARLTGNIWPGVLLGSISFGFGHLYQGLSGVVLISIYGFMFCLLYLARGSLIPCIIAHALQDILAAFAV
ncbi:MAG: CPBP family intramembrane metalloprotease [candidate division Zixibacteria bacterium]|nr:CPBP family intramembrane metalloprotease [candidate division Zixibacteria bacterium]